MEGKPLIDFDWIYRHLDDVGTRTIQHLTLTLIPIALGFVIALFLAIWVARQPRVYGPLLAVSGLLYTIPSLAAFAFLRPIFGLSLITAVIPLTTYTLLILLRNNTEGFRAVPPEVLEAAEGMGYSRWERLRRIELPLAVPLMVAGIRLAIVTTIGLATVVSILGDSFGGYGQFLTEGFQTLFSTKIYLGAFLSVALAFTADFILVRAERRLTPWAQARAGRTS
jgi:osmoprotectant transport system permease protein